MRRRWPCFFLSWLAFRYIDSLASWRDGVDQSETTLIRRSPPPPSPRRVHRCRRRPSIGGRLSERRLIAVMAAAPFQLDRVRTPNQPSPVSMQMRPSSSSSNVSGLVRTWPQLDRPFRLQGIQRKAFGPCGTLADHKMYANEVVVGRVWTRPDSSGLVHSLPDPFGYTRNPKEGLFLSVLSQDMQINASWTR